MMRAGKRNGRSPDGFALHSALMVLWICSLLCIGTCQYASETVWLIKASRQSETDRIVIKEAAQMASRAAYARRCGLEQPDPFEIEIEGGNACFSLQDTYIQIDAFQNDNQWQARVYFDEQGIIDLEYADL